MKNKHKIIVGSVLALTCGAVFLTAAAGLFEHAVKGNGNITKQILNTTSINEIDASGSYNISVLPGDKTQISIKGDSNLLPYVVVKTQGNRLIIATKKDVLLNPSKTFDVQITGANALKQINTHGKIIFSDNVMNTPSFTANTSGRFIGALSGSIQVAHFNFQGNTLLSLKDNAAQHIQFDIAGKNNIALAGKTHDLTINSAGNAHFSAKQLIADHLTLSSAGKFSIDANVTKRMDISSAGMTTVNYLGNPEIHKAGFGYTTVQKIEA